VRHTKGGAVLGEQFYVCLGNLKADGTESEELFVDLLLDLDLPAGHAFMM